MRLSARQFLRLLFTTSVWGANTVLIKALFAYFPALELQALRISMAALTFVPVVVMHSRKEKFSSEAKRLAFAAAFCMVFLHQVFLATGMTTAKAGLTSLILSLNPLATSVIAHFVLGETLTKRRLAGVLIGFVGVSAAVVQEWHLLDMGIGVAELLIFVAMLTYVMGGIFVRKAREHIAPLPLTALIHVYGAAMLIVPATASALINGLPEALPGPLFWVGAISSAVIATSYCNFLWNRSIQEIGASTTSIFANVMPFVSLITASAFLHERITLFQIAGLGAVILGIYLATPSDARSKQTQPSTVSP